MTVSWEILDEYKALFRGLVLLKGSLQRYLLEDLV